VELFAKKQDNLLRLSISEKKPYIIHSVLPVIKKTFDTVYSTVRVHSGQLRIFLLTATALQQQLWALTMQWLCWVVVGQTFFIFASQQQLFRFIDIVFHR
jgi:hypothetical protein